MAHASRFRAASDYLESS